MNRREHSHLDAEASSVVFILTRNVIRQSLVRTRPPFGRPRSSRTLPPTFLFLQSSVFKEQTSHAQCHGLHRFWLQAFECRSRGSLDFVQLSRPAEANFFVASSVAAVVGEAYIVGSSAKCQLRFPFFFVFCDDFFHMGSVAVSFPRGRCLQCRTCRPHSRRKGVRNDQA